MLAACGGGGSSSSPTPVAMGNLQVMIADGPSPSYEEIVLNVVSVRLNPSTDANVSETDKHWVTIAAPAPFVGSPQPTMETPVDLNQLNNQAIVFATGKIDAKTYNQIELVLDPNNPGYVIPLCGFAGTAAEGCINYPLKLAVPNTNLRATFPVTVEQNATVPLLIDITPTITAIPTSSTGSFTANVAMSVASVPNPAVGTITGTITGGDNVTVSAELSGTSTVVATAKESSGSYTLTLPASPVGTLYDLFASGSGTSLGVKSEVMVTQNGTTTVDFTLSSSSHAGLRGTITDGCTGADLQGVNLELLVPDPTFSPNPPSDCSGLQPPAGCVVVATAQTGSNGQYPVTNAFTNSNNTPFQSLPINTNYTLRVSYSGYNLGLMKVSTSGSALKCLTSGFPNDACSFQLERATITGSVSVSPAPTVPLNVLVVAEDHGTNNIENVATATVQPGLTTGAFSISVPDNSSTESPVSSFDLFATAQDTFGGRTVQLSTDNPTTGHTIGVVSDVAGAAKCQTSTDMPTIGGIDCVAGNGSIAGTTSTYDSQTSIELSKSGVQLMQSGVGLGSSNAGDFNFCAPSDGTAYTLQRYENNSPAGMTTNVTVAPSTTVMQPCSSICPTGSNTCFVCTNTSGVTVP